MYENISYITGSHTIKGGMAIINSTEEVLYNPGYGTFNFDGRFTGVQLADFMLGLPASSSRGEIRPNVFSRIREYAAYIRDDWRVTSKLTVSYGIRWDRYPPATEKNDLYFNFGPASGKMVVPNQAALGKISKLWPTTTLPVVLASSLGYPEKLTNATQRWLPRMSLAYRLSLLKTSPSLCRDAAGRLRTRNPSSPPRVNYQAALLQGGSAPGEIALRASGVAERARDTLRGRSRSHVGAVARGDQFTRVQAALRSYR